MADTPPPVTAAAPASCKDDLADDLFVSAIAGGGDSPTGDTDSGLFGVHTDTESAAAAVAPADASVPAASTPGGGKTGGSDTMEDLSLQDDIPNSEIPLDDDPRDKVGFAFLTRHLINVHSNCMLFRGVQQSHTKGGGANVDKNTVFFVKSLIKCPPLYAYDGPITL